MIRFRILILSFLSAVVPGRSHAGWTMEVVADTVETKGDFVGYKELSGLATVDGIKFLVASNESRGAQIATLSRNPWVITTGPQIPLMIGAGQAECDFEAVAADAKSGYFYVLGSHGVSVKKGNRREEQETLFRIPAGMIAADGEVETGKKIAKISLWSLLTQSPTLAPFLGKPLQLNGLNLEGLACKDGKLWIGCRAPVHGSGSVAVLVVDAEIVFSTPSAQWPKAKVHMLDLGKSRGVRDMVAVKDAFLIIAGPSGSAGSEQFPNPQHQDVDEKFALFHWIPDVPAGLKEISAVIPPKTNSKPEGIMVIEESDSEILILMLHDQRKNGTPRVLRLKRK